MPPLSPPLVHVWSASSLDDRTPLPAKKKKKKKTWLHTESVLLTRSERKWQFFVNFFLIREFLGIIFMSFDSVLSG